MAAKIFGITMPHLSAPFGPALMISMGYINLGKWVVTVDRGARFGYDIGLLVIIFNLTAIMCQYLAACIGMVSGKNLAEICSEGYCKPVCILLGVQAELSMISSELTTAHWELSMEDRARLCDCLNVEKLSLEACKDLTKNPRIPAEISVQAMVSQQSRLQINTSITDNFNAVQTQRSSLGAQSEKASTLVVIFDENNDLRSNLKRMQSRVNELEKVCWEMKGQMSRIGKSKSFSWPSTHHSGRGTPRLC